MRGLTIGPAGFGFAQAGPDAVDDGDDERTARSGISQPVQSGNGAAEADPEAERAEDEGAVALAQRSVIAAGGADQRAEHAGELGERSPGRSPARCRRRRRARRSANGA